MTTGPRGLYLAYGSNLHPRRLQRRTPSARLVGTVRLAGWALRFNKRSVDGSAKCNVVAAAADAAVHCAVFAIDGHHLPALDQAEGAGYAVRRLRIPEYGRVFIYVARPHYVDERLAPYRWYRDLVVAGARYHGFPHGYVEALAAVAATADPDAARARRQRCLVSAITGD